MPCNWCRWTLRFRRSSILPPSPRIRWLAASALLPWLLLPHAAAAWTERDIALPSNPAPLFGTLAMPDGAGAVTGVLMLGGSGPTDRDGNQPGMYNDSLKLLAHGLADCGVASLRVDKRGIAASH